MKSRKKRTSVLKNPSRAGSVTVEFALTMPIALMVTFGLVEFSRVNMIRNTMQNAAYEGARAAIVPGGTAQSATDKANDVLSSIRVRNSAVNVTPSTITADTKEIAVEISIPLGDNMWVTPRYFANHTMTKECKLTRESTDNGH